MLQNIAPCDQLHAERSIPAVRCQRILFGADVANLNLISGSFLGLHLQLNKNSKIVKSMYVFCHTVEGNVTRFGFKPKNKSVVCPPAQF